LVYSTYLGGLQADVGQAIATDSPGNVFVSGYTFSLDFPLQNPYQGATGGSPDAFVTGLDATGSTLLFSTFLGGSGDDRGMGVAVDSTGNIYAAGVTRSTDFPTTVGALQTIQKGERDAFVTKLVPSGTGVAYSTFLGGSGADQANAISVDSSGNAFVTGFTQSSDFPILNPVQTVLGISGGGACGTSPCADAFVSQLNASGAALVYSTFLGGSGRDFGQAIRLGPSNIPYIAGSTLSTNFPAIAGAYQGSLSSIAGNAFAAKIDSANLPSIALVPSSLAFGNQPLGVQSSEKTVTVVNEGTAPLTITDIEPSGDFLESDDCIGTLSAGGGYCTIRVSYNPSDLGSDSEDITITDGASGSPHTIAVTGTGVAATTAVTLLPKSLTFADLSVGSVSDPQTVTIINSGTSSLTIGSIGTSISDYVQTNNCGDKQNILQEGESCVVSVSFQPVGSGARNGILSISSNASGSPHSVALSGTGLAVFSLSSPTPTNTVTVGTSTATFTVAATAPDTFSGNISLSCPTGITCEFSPEEILSGQSSTLTVSDLTAATPNPLNITVTGISGAQTAKVALTLLMADYTLTVSPALNTIVAGQTADYTVVLTPSSGFNQEVSFSCENLPRTAKCEFSQKSVTPGGSAVNVGLTITTIKNASVPYSGNPFGSDRTPPALWLLLLLSTGLLLLLQTRRRAETLRSPLLPWKIALVCLVLAFLMTLGGCRGTTVVGGTPTGNYTVTVRGTMKSNTDVQRTASFNLAVT